MSHPSRSIALTIVLALLAAMFAMLGAPQAANAAGNQDGVGGHGNNQVFAYVQAGESLTASGDPGRIGNVVGPDGTVHTGVGTYGPATQDGVWRVHLVGAGFNVAYDWTVDVESADGTVIPGRVWASSDVIIQRTSGSFPDLNYWVVNNTGYVYAVELAGYNGVNSVIEANSVGWADEVCAPTYASYEYDADGIGSNAPPLPDCGEAFRIFYEEPSADLPVSATSAQGEMTILPSVLNADELAVDDLAFASASTGAAAGTFTYSINPRFTGGYFLQVDVDGNGSYGDAIDRSIRLGADGSGSYSHEFDGLDGTGALIEDCTAMNAQVHFDKLGETHIVQTDVEAREGGISITRLNGAQSPDSRIHWNDEGMAGTRVTTTDPITAAAVDSSAGVHDWAYDVNGWGNGRYIDDWAYLPADFGTGEISFGGRCLTVEKTSDATEATRVGDTVEYTVTATNTGDTDYTVDEPATVFDDLSGVLDDAEYNGDAAATVGAPEFIAPSHLRWSGALAAGESVELTYSVTLAAGGDGDVRNVAWTPLVPPPGVEVPPTPDCNPADADGRDPVTGEPCGVEEYDLPRLAIEKTSDVVDLPADGGVVTYEVTVTNQGPGVYTEDAPAVLTDDLSDVLDDATFGEIIEPESGAVFDEDAQEITWSGALDANESMTFSYTVTYDSSTGDNVLFNVVCVPADETAPGADNCATNRVPAAELDVTKSVDPASGSAVDAGQTVTYTLSFDSLGEAAATVDKVDDLSDVFDDAAFMEGSLVVSDDALTATLDGDALTVTGSVPAGEVYTVTYSVIVDAYADQGNHILANVVQNPDETCDPDGCEETNNPIRHFNVTKSATPTEGVLAGGTVEYTITVTNDGEADYTAEVPAGVTDDMSDVLDDASYNGDAVAVASDGTTVPAPTFSTPVLAWSGPLAVGESVEITFTVAATNQGDTDLVNVATPVCADGVICDPPTPPVEIFMPKITPTKSSDPATGSDVLAGQVVNYTLTFTNDGTATGAVDATDDLSDVLDDAELTLDPSTDVAAVTAVFDVDTETIRIEGDLEAGATVTVTYQVTVLPDGERGDNISSNIVTPDNPPYVCAEGDAECEPFVPPTTEHFVGELDDWKTVDPASGATVRPGQVMTYTLHFENIGEAPVDVDREDVLTQILDDAAVTSVPVSSDAALTVTEIAGERFGISGSLEPGQLVTVTYQVTVNADGDRGDDRLGNFLVNTGEEPPTECVPADDERPDCTVNHVSNVVVTKSADPTSGTEVEQGERVTYTLTFRNVSTNVDAEDAAIDYTDHMADVLDDATLTGMPTSSNAAVTATAAGETIRVVGAVASGETVTVTYAVTVKAYADQGNHHLGNVVAVTGEEPICAAGSALCTSHDLTEPDPLAATGGDIAWSVAAGGLLLLLLGGGALFLARSRREAAGSLTS